MFNVTLRQHLPQFLNTLVRYLSLRQRQIMKFGQPLKMLQALVRYLRPVEHQAFEANEPSQMHKPSIGHPDVVEIQFLELCQLSKELQQPSV